MSGSVRAGETPFVGRRTEMALLLDRLAGASHGRGGIVLITGEPGIGKTRLAAEFAAAAAGAGAVVRWGRCYEGEGAPAFWPWMHLLRAHLSDQPGQTVALGLPGVLAELGRLLPELSERLTGPSSPRLEPAQSRFRLFAAVTAFLIADARAAPPLALTLDDLHWADQPSLLLLQFLAREVSGAPLLVVGTYRDTELAEGHPLRGALAQLIREPWVERLPLSGLSVPEIAGYLTTVSGSAPPEDVAAALHRDTNGNPLYVTELAPLLGADPSPQSERRPALSAGVRQTVTLRLDRLSPACRRLLDLAAVCGPDFDAGLLAAAGHLDRDTLFDALEEAERARILVAMEGVPGRFAFSHALVQAALYEEIPTARRIRLHYHVGAALERAWVDDPTHYPAILAHHFHQAAALGAAGRAATWSGRAGDQALASLAYEEAVRHYERALQALDAPLQAPRPAAERRAERRTLLLALGDALNCSGRRDEARDVFAAAATLARGTSPDASARNAADLGRAALGFAGPLVSVGAVDGASVALLEEALATPAAEPAVRARLLARLAMELAWSADAERRARLCAEAIDLVRSTADAAGRAYVLHARHYALWTPDNLAQRRVDADSIVHLALEAGDRGLELQGRHWRIADLLEMGDIAAVDTELLAYAGPAQDLRQPFHLWYVARGKAMRATLAGQFAEADRLIDQARALAISAGRDDAGTVHAAQLFTLRRLQGRLDEMEPLFRDLMERAPALPVFRCAMALIWLHVDRPDAARQELARLSSAAGRGLGFGGLRRDGLWLLSLGMLADVCVALGDREGATALYPLLLPFAGRAITNGIYAAACHGPVARPLGALAAILGRWPEVERHFEDALDLATRMGARPWSAFTQYEYAAALLARPGLTTTVCRRAITLLRSSRATAGELGMARLATMATTLLSDAAADGKGPFPASLTPREVEVLRLVAAGRSNREIADALVISRFTAVRHVSNILAKTGATNRTEAAGFAARHGLV